MGYLANVNPKYFAAINLFAGVKDVRFYINGVRIEPHPVKGAILVATNGHTMAAIHDPDGFCSQPIIVGSIGKDLLRACRSAKPAVPGADLRLWIDAQSAVIAEGHDEPAHPFDQYARHASRIELIDGKYPDWRRVLTGASQRHSQDFPAVNPAYLALIDEAASILCPALKGWRAPVRLFGRGETVSIIARIPYMEMVDRFVAMVMPMTDEYCYSGVLPTAFKPRVSSRQPAAVEA